MKNSILVYLFIAVFFSLFTEAKVETVNFEFNKPFSLSFGSTAVGPDHLTIWYNSFGSAPGFTVEQKEQGLDFFWAHRLLVEETAPVMRGRFGEYEIEVQKFTSDEDHAATVTMAKRKVKEITWGEVIELESKEIIQDPEGSLWAINNYSELLTDKYLILDKLEKGRRSPQETRIRIPAGDKPSVERFHDVSIKLHKYLYQKNKHSSVQITLFKPSLTVLQYEYGKTISLMPAESFATSDGLRIKLLGYGHKIAFDGQDAGFLEFRMTHEGQTEERQVMLPVPQSGSAPIAWKMWKIKIMKCEDDGPPHSWTAETEFSVTRPAQAH